MIGTYHGVPVWCNLDGCGIICVLATWGMLLYAVYVITFVVLRPTPFEECLSAGRVLTSVAFIMVAGLAATSHVRTMLTDPGSVPRHASPVPVKVSQAQARYPETEGKAGGDEEGLSFGGNEDIETSRLTARIDGMSVNHGDTDHDDFVLGEGGGGGRGGEAGLERRKGGLDSEDLSVAAANERRNRQPPQPPVKWCHKCDAFKPPRAHHCSLCQRCIVKMDHHCPWVNNCVGIGNQKLFLLFCAYTCALCVFALGIIGIEIAVIGDSGHKEACRMKPSDHVATVALVAMSIMFGLFTCCMACDQCQVASTNQTKIDRLKGEVHDSVEGANEVFGGEDGTKCRCHWAIPVPARFPAGEKAAQIFGYYCINRNGSSGGDAGPGGPGGRESILARRRDDVEMAEYDGVPTDDLDSALRVGRAGRYREEGGSGGKFR